MEDQSKDQGDKHIPSCISVCIKSMNGARNDKMKASEMTLTFDIPALRRFVNNTELEEAEMSFRVFDDKQF